MNARFVTETDAHDVPDSIPFVLTPQDRDRVAIAKLELERHRRTQNRREADMAMAVWNGNQYRERNT